MTLIGDDADRDDFGALAYAFRARWTWSLRAVIAAVREA